MSEPVHPRLISVFFGKIHVVETPDELKHLEVSENIYTWSAKNKHVKMESLHTFRTQKGAENSLRLFFSKVKIPIAKKLGIKKGDLPW